MQKEKNYKERLYFSRNVTILIIFNFLPSDLEVISWAKDTHGLYDYESQEKITNNFSILESGNLNSTIFLFFLKEKYYEIIVKFK